jgi:hypothetical protein
VPLVWGGFGVYACVGRNEWISQGKVSQIAIKPPHTSARTCRKRPAQEALACAGGAMQQHTHRRARDAHGRQRLRVGKGQQHRLRHHPHRLLHPCQIRERDVDGGRPRDAGGPGRLKGGFPVLPCDGQRTLPARGLRQGLAAEPGEVGPSKAPRPSGQVLDERCSPGTIVLPRQRQPRQQALQHHPPLRRRRRAQPNQPFQPPGLQKRRVQPLYIRGDADHKDALLQSGVVQALEQCGQSPQVRHVPRMGPRLPHGLQLVEDEDAGLGRAAAVSKGLVDAALGVPAVGAKGGGARQVAVGQAQVPCHCVCPIHANIMKTKKTEEAG